MVSRSQSEVAAATQACMTEICSTFPRPVLRPLYSKVQGLGCGWWSLPKRSKQRSRWDLPQRLNLATPPCWLLWVLAHYVVGEINGYIRRFLLWTPSQSEQCKTIGICPFRCRLLTTLCEYCSIVSVEVPSSKKTYSYFSRLRSGHVFQQPPVYSCSIF